MSEKLLIIGAKGFARELLETVTQTKRFVEIRFYDDLSDDLPDRLFEKFEIITNFEDATKFLNDGPASFALGIGNPIHREKLFARFIEAGAIPAQIVSPFAKIGTFDNRIGEGATILTDAVIETSNRIGKGCLLHVGALVSHDVVVGDFCELSPRATLLGGVRLGARCRIGAGAVILPRVRLGNDVVVGAGAVVTKDVDNGITVVGVPATPIDITNE